MIYWLLYIGKHSFKSPNDTGNTTRILQW
jgi:hypothetical protein